VLDKLLPLLGGNHTPPKDGIIALRNVLAHSGRLSETDERRFLEAHAPRFEQLIQDASCFTKVQVVGSPAPGKAFLLHGLPARGTPFPEFDLASLPSGITPPQPDRLLLITGNHAIDLFPLHAYGDVFHYLDKTREEVRAAGKAGTDPRANFEPVPEASPATLLYFRRGAKDYLEYTSLSSYAAHSQEGFAALERFRQVFQLEQWRRNAEARQGRKEFDFADWRKELLELFVGRGEQVRQVGGLGQTGRHGDLLDQRASGGGQVGVHGGPGGEVLHRREALLQGRSLLSGIRTRRQHMCSTTNPFVVTCSLPIRSNTRSRPRAPASLTCPFNGAPYEIASSNSATSYVSARSI
jgi:hypothetical protein